MTFFINLLNSAYGYFGIAFGVTVVSFLLYGKIVKTLTKLKTRDSDVDDLRKTMPRVEAALQSISKQVEDLPKIRAELNLFIGSRASSVAQSMSPLSLNSHGETLSQEFEAEKIIDQNYQELKNMINKEEINNAFDVQQISLSLARSFFALKKDDDLLNKAKEIAYEKGISSLDLYTIFGILLRNKILKELNLSHDDIDKHDPNSPQ